MLNGIKIKFNQETEKKRDYWEKIFPKDAVKAPIQIFASPNSCPSHHCSTIFYEGCIHFLADIT